MMVELVKKQCYMAKKTRKRGRYEGQGEKVDREEKRKKGRGRKKKQGLC